MLQALAPYVCAFVGVQPQRPCFASGSAGTGVGKRRDSLYALRFYPTGVHTALSLSENTKAPI